MARLVCLAMKVTLTKMASLGRLVRLAMMATTARRTRLSGRRAG